MTNEYVTFQINVETEDGLPSNFRLVRDGELGEDPVQGMDVLLGIGGLVHIVRDIEESVKEVAAIHLDPENGLNMIVQNMQKVDSHPVLVAFTGRRGEGYEVFKPGVHAALIDR